MGDDSVTHKDLARHVGVSETTIKSYRRKFPEFFPVRSSGKPIRFEPQALEICGHIRRCFSRDLSVEETRRHLAGHFPSLRPQRASHPSKSTTPEPDREVRDTLERLAAALESFSRAQTEANAKLDGLREVMADFLSLHLAREDVFAQGMEEIKRAWSRQLRQVREHSDAGGVRRVTVRNAYGHGNDYVIERGPEPYAAGDAETPPESMLKLPLVVLSAAGDYLGVAGKSAGNFSIEDFRALHAKAYPPPRHLAEIWTRHHKGWLLELEQQEVIRPNIYSLLVDAVQTPKGNDVALLRSFTIGGRELPGANLYTFIKQMQAQAV